MVLNLLNTWHNGSHVELNSISKIKNLGATVAVDEKLHFLKMALDLSLFRHHTPIPPIVTIVIPPVNQPEKTLQII